MGLKTSEHSGKKQAPLSRRNDEESKNMNEEKRGGMIKTQNPKTNKAERSISIVHLVLAHECYCALRIQTTDRKCMTRRH